MDLIQMGARLRREREARKLSLGDVTEATKISRRILVAFEDGDMDHFPHPVYAKGFVRNYAKLLGMDPLDCVRVLEREYCPPDAEEDDRETRGVSLSDLRDPSGKEISSERRPWGAAILVLLLVGILAALIWYMAQSGREERAAEQAVSSAGEVVEAQEAESAAVEPEIVEAEQEGVAAESGQAPVQQPEAATEIGGSAGVAPPEEPPAVIPDGMHRLVVTATDENGCWVGVFRRDGEEGETPWFDEFTVQPGQSVSYEFTGERRFRFGSLESVRIELDGEARVASGSGVVDVALP